MTKLPFCPVCKNNDEVYEVKYGKTGAGFSIENAGKKVMLGNAVDHQERLKYHCKRCQKNFGE